MRNCKKYSTNINGNILCESCGGGEVPSKDEAIPGCVHPSKAKLEDMEKMALANCEIVGFYTHFSKKSAMF